ncbi:MAG: xanthine dehydrogenase family protein subunit M [Salinigranum sp.]
MYPSEFEYYRADDVTNALDLLADNPGAEILAGGHSLLPTMKSGLSSPPALVDIGHIDSIKGIDVEDDVVKVGALTNYATVADSEVVQEEVPVVAQAAHEIGDIQVRNRGTVGGNVAHADPASDLPAAVLAADATLVVEGPDGEREVDVDEFFFGMYATDVAEDEILTRIELPRRGATGAYVKKPSPSSGYAMVGVAASVLFDDDGAVSEARVAANGVQDHAVRLGPVEEELTGNSLDEDVVDAAGERADEDMEEFMLMDDLQASGEFRAQLLRVFTKRALNRVAESA